MSEARNITQIVNPAGVAVAKFSGSFVELTAIGAAASVPGTADITASKFFALSDNGVKQVVNSASSIVLTIPINAGVAFGVRTTDIPVLRLGTGAVTITGTVGVTVNGVSGGSVAIATQYQGVVVQKVATDTWVVSGNY